MTTLSNIELAGTGPDSRHLARRLPLPTKYHIRIVGLQPYIQNSKEPIVAFLKVVSMSRMDTWVHGSYEAISYTWGPEPTISIEVDGVALDIRQNLHQCLLRLRRPDKTRFLWNDFLCIDQHDQKEKARQVSIIGNIFKTAERVLAWVGEHENGSEMLFRGWPAPRNSKVAAGTDLPSPRRSPMMSNSSGCRSGALLPAVRTGTGLGLSRKSFFHSV
jgi:hypothetical protein